MRTSGRPLSWRSGQKPGEEPAGEAADSRLNRVDADPFEMAQSDFDGGNAQIVQRAILEARFPRRQDVKPSLDGGEVDRAAGEPRPLQAGERGIPNQEAADAGRVAEHLVERDRDEVRSDGFQIEPVGRDERRRIEQDVPAVRARPRSTSASGCLTPEKFDCAGNANRFGLRGVRGLEP